MTKADWLEVLTIFIRTCMMWVRWAQAKVTRLKEEE